MFDNNIKNRMKFAVLIAFFLSSSAFAFQQDIQRHLSSQQHQQQLGRSTTSQLFSSVPSDVSTYSSSSRSLDEIKAELVQTCNRPSKPLLEEIRTIVRELEEKAEMVGIGQASSVSGLLDGEWELLFSPEDVTRSSPFFWAFRKAFPDQSDEIFAITDAIPSPLKEVGPAYQTIELNQGTQSGTFVSRVKVATLGGLATSIMTTRYVASFFIFLFFFEKDLKKKRIQKLFFKINHSYFFVFCI